MRISKHISYKEGVHSNTAKRKGIENTPDEEQLANMKMLAEKISNLYSGTDPAAYIYPTELYPK